MLTKRLGFWAPQELGHGIFDMSKKQNRRAHEYLPLRDIRGHLIKPFIFFV